VDESGHLVRNSSRRLDERIDSPPRQFWCSSFLAIQEYESVYSFLHINDYPSSLSMTGSLLVSSSFMLTGWFALSF
jgi:hypothetical protein